jgi:hypothetical protein
LAAGRRTRHPQRGHRFVDQRGHGHLIGPGRDKPSAGPVLQPGRGGP